MRTRSNFRGELCHRSRSARLPRLGSGVAFCTRHLVAMLVYLKDLVVICRMGDNPKEGGRMGGSGVKAADEVNHILGLSQRAGSNLGKLVDQSIGSPVNGRET